MALERLGRRLAARILDGPAPALATAKWEAPGRLRLHFTQRVSVPSGGRIHGFELAEPGVFHAMQEASTGDILLLVGPTKNRELFYCRGLNPVCDLATASGQALPAFGPVAVP
jgi:hypothetical protein